MPISRPAAPPRAEPARRHVGRPRRVPAAARDRAAPGDARDRGLRLAGGPWAPVGAIDAQADAGPPTSWSPVLRTVLDATPGGAEPADLGAETGTAPGTGRGTERCQALESSSDPAAEPGVGPEADADLATRWRRGALGAVATAYGAAHGHPLAPQETRPAARRWALGARPAAVALAALVAVAAAVVAVAFSRGAGDPLLGAAPAVTFPAPSVDGTPGAAAGAGAPAAAPAAVPQSGPPSGPGAGGRADPAGGSAAGEGVAAAGSVVVDVVGAVRHPGVRTLATGARVADAITAAGGTTVSADVEQLNLARPVVDGEQVRVPRQGEQLAPAGEPAAASGAGGTVDGVTGAGAPAAGLVDLNTADVATLDGLPGIGPVIAQRIVDRRTEVGAFTTVDQLDEVSGIGPALLAKVRDLVRV